MSSWLEICVTIQDEASVEAVADVLQLFAVDDEGVAVEQLGDPNDVSPTAMLPETLVKLYVDEARDSAQLRHAIITTLNTHQLPSPAFTLIRQQDWANAWKTYYKPLRVGARFWIHPTWLPVETVAPDDLLIMLDPGMAFGTGTHETTQLCLRALETYLQPEDDVLDLGTGSGILAIGAALLGAGPILAVDTDELAVSATIENAAQNNVAQHMDVRHGTLDVVDRKGWRVVVANILAPTIIELLQRDALESYVAAGGTLILSGILAVQADDVIACLQDTALIEVLQQGDWVAIIAQRGR